jgi:hypothetical protein
MCVSQIAFYFRYHNPKVLKAFLQLQVSFILPTYIIFDLITPIAKSISYEAPKEEISSILLIPKKAVVLWV